MALIETDVKLNSYKHLDNTALVDLVLKADAESEDEDQDEVRELQT